jgi:hypothetical protein
VSGVVELSLMLLFDVLLVTYPDIFFWGVTPGIFSGGGGSTNSVEDRGQREWGSGRGSPLVRGSTQFQMNETHILVRLLRMYIPQNWEFGSALAKF